MRVDYKKPLSQAAGEEEEETMVAEALTTLLAQQQLKTEQVCLGVPGRIVLPRILHLPAAVRAKMATMVEIEAKHLVPIRLDQLAWDFQVLSGGEDGRDAARSPPKKGVVTVLFAAARRKLLSKRMELVARAGIPVDLVQSDCIALHNFLLFQRAAGRQDGQDEQPAGQNGQAADSPPSQWPVMLVDVGGDGSNFLVSSPSGLWVRHLGFGGYSITRAGAAVQSHHVAGGGVEAESGGGRQPGRPLQRAGTGPGGFSAGNRHFAGAYAKTEHSQPVRQMLGVGGGFALHGLLGYLRSMP